MALATPANPHTFVDAFRFIVDNPDLLLTQGLGADRALGAALGVALVVALPLGIVLGHLHRGSNARDRRVDLRPGACRASS